MNWKHGKYTGTNKWSRLTPQQKAKQKERVLLAWRKLKDQVFVLLGRECKRCGFNDIRALEVDHVKDNGAEERKKLRPWMVLKRVLLYPQDYQILCANCNRIKEFDTCGRKN